MPSKYEGIPDGVLATDYFLPSMVLPTPPDPRNFTPLPRTTALPHRASAFLVGSPARNQHQKGSCTCFAAMAILENAMAFAGYSLDGSEEYLYARLREIHGWLCQNTGTYPGDAVGYLTNEGTLTEERRPYSDDLCQGTGENERADAGQWRATDYVQCRNLQEVKAEIAAGYKVMLCMNVKMNINYLENGELLTDPRNSAEYGGHAMCVEDYDDERYDGTLSVQNSWSSGFGRNGRFLLPYWIFELPEDQGGVWKGDLWSMHVARKPDPKPEPVLDDRTQMLAIGTEMLTVMDTIIRTTKGNEKYQNRLRRQGMQALFERLRNEV